MTDYRKTQLYQGTFLRFTSIQSALMWSVNNSDRQMFENQVENISNSMTDAFKRFVSEHSLDAKIVKNCVEIYCYPNLYIFDWEYMKNNTAIAQIYLYDVFQTIFSILIKKVQAMNGWKRGKPYAMVVCPIYQLPTSSSQIYQQATTQNVCIFTYSHLAVLLAYSVIGGKEDSKQLLKNVFETIIALNPSKSSTDYWLAINKSILSFSKKIPPIWDIEKGVATESISIAKEEALTYLAKEREKIMQMSHQEALLQLIRVNKIDYRIKTISAITDNGLFTLK